MTRAVTLAALALMAAGELWAEEGIELELVAQAMIPADLRFEGTCVGGLSALAWDAESGRYYAVSDSARGARLYKLEIEIVEGEEPGLGSVAVEQVIRLSTREGVPYPDDRVDPEGLALVGDGTAYLSSEGAASLGVPPFVDRIEVESGAWLASLPIPLDYRPRFDDGGAQSAGVRRNRGFEALTLSPDGRHLVVGSESALAQDAPAEPEPGEETHARLLHYRLDGAPRLAGELHYPLLQPPGDVVVHGLVELLALDDEPRLLALERTFSRDRGLDLSFFVVALGDARAGAPGALPVVVKRPLLDLRQLGILPENFEGLAFGPRLADGSETLLVLGDNDNTECAAAPLSHLRPTRILLFRLRRSSGTSPGSFALDTGRAGSGREN